MHSTSLPSHTAKATSALALTVSALLVGCSSEESDVNTTSATAPSSSTPATSSSSADGGASTDGPVSSENVVGTVVRFAAGDNIVDVTIDTDTPATRDFVSMLPMTLELEEFNGREKIADLPRELDYEGTSGFDPEDGDLIYFTPWGNLGFYYNADGVGYSDQTLKLGTYEATSDDLAAFEGQETSVTVVE